MFTPQVQPNDELREKQKTLYIVFGIGIILLFARFFIDINLAIRDMMIYLLFWCGVAFYNYCMLAFFVIMLLFSLLNYVSLLGTIIQVRVLTAQFNTGFKGPVAFVVAVIGLTIIYNVAACWFCYDAYKVFKYETSKNYGGSIGQQNIQMETGKNADLEGGKSQFRAFKGPGVKIGN